MNDDNLDGDNEEEFVIKEGCEPPPPPPVEDSRTDLGYQPPPPPPEAIDEIKGYKPPPPPPQEISDEQTDIPEDSNDT